MGDEHDNFVSRALFLALQLGGDSQEVMRPGGGMITCRR